jgi:long-chain acyl-CoA synthetase
VPALVDILAVKIERRGKSAEEALGRPLKWILSGGAPLSRRTYERMKALGVEVLSAYGLTESTALFSIDPCDRKPAVGSSGLRTMLSSCETAVSEEGELLIRGPSVMKGYLNAPEKTAKSIDKNGWLHTGDYGRIDEEGNVYVVGRISRTIILSTGKKISPEEIEESLMSLPEVLEAFVSGHAQTREITAEIYTLTSEDKVRSAIDEFNGSQPVYKRIDSVKIRRVPFERTSSGKVRVAR